MKKIISRLLSAALIVGLFFTSGTKLYAAETRNPYEHLGSANADMIGDHTTFSNRDHVWMYIYNGSYLGYKNVDFGDGAVSVTICASTYTTSPSALDVKLDSRNSEPVGRIDFDTKGSSNFVENTLELDEPITGIHDVYFTFPASVPKKYIQVDYWYATKAPEPEPTNDLTLEYTVNNWGSGYNVDFNVVNNTDEDIVGWTLKILKSDCPINSSWSVNIKEDGDYYVITPLDWNSIVPANGSIAFGINGTGELAETIEYVFEEPVAVEEEELGLDYSIQKWDSGYNVNFTLTNNSNQQLNGWTLKLKKSEVTIDSSWSVKVNEDGDYYVLTPENWNAIIGANGNTTFGFQGSGEIGDVIEYVFQ
ncbi:MAG: cellulose binding domain-containing protein [Pseudobutyrivibrio sp.]|nr:cellulose binding domain-containing protein [Pseudobutyrivibrio sp.]